MPVRPPFKSIRYVIGVENVHNFGHGGHLRRQIALNLANVEQRRISQRALAGPPRRRILEETCQPLTS